MQVPQTPLELITGYLGFAHTNINNNIDAIPDDKIDWKPAPEAKSVLEIITHATATVNFFTSVMLGKDTVELPPATDKASAKALVTQVIENHLAGAKSLAPEQMQHMVKLPMGEFPAGFVADCLLSN